MTRKRSLRPRRSGFSTARFIAVAGRPALLSADEERETAWAYRRTGAARHKHKLVQSNIRLVIKLAYEHGRLAPWAIDDLIQEGSIGLLEAVDRFDPGRGVRFASYATWWIRAFMLKHLIDNTRLVRFGRSRDDRRRFFKGERPPAELSLDGVVGNASPDDGTRLGDLIADDSVVAADEELERRDLSALLERQAENLERELDGRGRRLLRGRLLAEEPPPFSVLASEMSLSRERVRQLERRVFEQLRRRVVRATALAA